MAESGKAPGSLITKSTATEPTTTSDKPRSLFDSIDPNLATASNSNGAQSTNGKTDKSKTTDMKTEGVKPLAALGPILGILGLVIALVLWNQNHTAAIIAGLVGLAILILWFLARRAKKAAAANNSRKKPARQAPRNSHDSTRYQRRPFGLFRRRRRQPYGSRDGVHESPGNTSRDRSPWWRRGRRNLLNRDRRHSRNDPRSSAHERERIGRDSNSRSRRPSLNPFRRRQDRDRSRGPRSDRSGNPDHRSSNTDSRGSNRKFRPSGGSKSRRRSNSNIGGSRTPHVGSGSDSSPSSGGNRRKRKWYDPRTWGSRNNNGSSGHGSDNDPRGSGNQGTSGVNGSGKPRWWRLRNGIRRLWGWQIYDPAEESVNGYPDPNQRNRFRDRWNGWRTRKQRDNYDYAGFAVDSDGQAGPHYSRWHDWRSQARARNWFTFGPENPNRATATRMDRTPAPGPSSPALSGHSLSLGSGSGISAQSFTQSAAPAEAPVNNGGRTMSSNGAMHTVGGRREAATHVAGAANSHRSAVWHIMVANQLRAWAARLANSDNPYHQASANNYAHMAAQANAVAQNDARLAATQMSESNRALGNGQRSIES